MTNDDDIVDAEIVDDESSYGVAVYVGDEGRLPAEFRYPPGTVYVPLTHQQRILIREALAHYHDKGPRLRNTHAILATISHMADNEVSLDCKQCDNTGKYRTMYAMEYCHCRRGIERRTSGS